MRKMLMLFALLLACSTALNAQELPKKPSRWRTTWRMVTCRHKVIDWQFCVAIGGHFAMANWDARTTKRFERLGCPENTHEVNAWLYGKCPSLKRMTFTHLGIVGGMGVVSYYAKRDWQREQGNLAERNGYWAWAYPQVAFSIGHGVAIKSNNDLVQSHKCPSGTVCR